MSELSEKVAKAIKDAGEGGISSTDLYMIATLAGSDITGLSEALRSLIPHVGQRLDRQEMGRPKAMYVWVPDGHVFDGVSKE